MTAETQQMTPPDVTKEECDLGLDELCSEYAAGEIIPQKREGEEKEDHQMSIDCDHVAVMTPLEIERISAAIFPDGDQKVDYNILDKEIEKRFKPVKYNKTLYIYNPVTGLYSEDVGSIEGWTKSILVNAVKKKLIYGKTPFTHIIEGSLSQASKCDPIEGKLFPFNKFAGIPVNNGVIIFDGAGKVTLADYEPDMMFTRKLPVNYLPEADPGPIDEILRDWLDEGDVEILYQIPAQSLMQSLPGREPNKKSYLIQGETNGGKSTYLNLLEAVFGTDNISGVSLDELPLRFNKSSIAGKFLNIADDIQSVGIKNVENFKAITGRRSHEIEEKFKPRYKDDITAVFCYTCNRPPLIEGVAQTDDAFWSRWELVKFPRTFPVVSGWLKEHLTEKNMEGFFARVVNITVAMLQNGGKLLVQGDIMDLKDRWERDSSPLLEFMEEHCEQGKTFKVGKDVFCDAFSRWVEGVEESATDKHDRRRRSPQTKKAMAQSLMRQGIQPGPMGGSKNRMEVYRGIQIKPSSPYAPKNETKNGVIV